MATESTSEVTGDEPQPEVIEVENTAVELDVAVVDEALGEGEQPIIEEPEKEDDAASAPAPRRRRRTTYRSRKRPLPTRVTDLKNLW